MAALCGPSGSHTGGRPESGDHLDKDWAQLSADSEDRRWDAWLLRRAYALTPRRPMRHVAAESLVAITGPQRGGGPQVTLNPFPRAAAPVPHAAVLGAEV